MPAWNEYDHVNITQPQMPAWNEYDMEKIPNHRRQHDTNITM